VEKPKGTFYASNQILFHKPHQNIHILFVKGMVLLVRVLQACGSDRVAPQASGFVFS